MIGHHGDHGIATSQHHQLLFVTPVMSPSRASFRKHKRHNANFRMYARGRPHRWQRLRSRILYFGFLVSLAIFAVVAMNVSQFSQAPQDCRNGIPMNCRSFLASWSVFAVVTTDTFM